MDSNFGSLYTEDGIAVGLYFKEDSQSDLEELLNLENFNLNYDQILENSNDKIDLTYGISAVMVKHSEDYQRGARMVSIGVLSKQRHFYCYKVLNKLEPFNFSP